MDGGNEAFILFCVSVYYLEGKFNNTKGEKQKKNNLQLPDIFYTTRHFWSNTGLMTAIVVAESGSLITRSLTCLFLVVSFRMHFVWRWVYTQQMDRRIFEYY